MNDGDQLLFIKAPRTAFGLQGVPSVGKQAHRTGALPPDALQQGEVIVFADSKEPRDRRTWPCLR